MLTDGQNGEACSIRMPPLPLDVKQFDVGSGVLTVNGVDFSGTEGPQGVRPQGLVQWKGGAGSRFRLCPRYPTTPAGPKDSQCTPFDQATIDTLIASVPTFENDPSYQVAVPDLDVINCPYWKFLVQENEFQSAGFFENSRCISPTESVAAFRATGLDDATANFFGLIVVGALAAPEQNPTRNCTVEKCCFSPFIQNDTPREHVEDTGFIDPLPNPDVFYSTLASIAATGGNRFNTRTKGFEAVHGGQVVANIDTWLDSNRIWLRNQACQVNNSGDVRAGTSTPFPTAAMILDMFGVVPKGGTRGAQMTLKAVFDFFMEGIGDRSAIKPDSVGLFDSPGGTFDPANGVFGDGNLGASVVALGTPRS